MSLIIPGVGSEAGPTYAEDVNASLTLIDQHDHTPGNGVQITPAGLNINAALTLNSNFLTTVAGVTFTAQSTTPAVSTIYENSVDLYFVDGVGNNIRLTQSGGLAGTPGSISGLVSPASATYVPISSTFVWQSNTNIAANMDFGAALLRNISPNSTFALTLQPPTLSSNYTITLPTIPASTSFMAMDNSGAISTTIATVGALTTTNLSASAGILGTQLANATITTTQISATAGILGSQLSTTAGIVGSQIGAGQIVNNNLNSAVTLNADQILQSTTHQVSSASTQSFTPGTTFTNISGLTSITKTTNAAGRYVMASIQATSDAGINLSTADTFHCRITDSVGGETYYWVQSISSSTLTLPAIFQFVFKAGVSQTTWNLTVAFKTSAGGTLVTYPNMQMTIQELI